MTDRSMSQDRDARQHACIHQFPITAPHSEQQPGDCERCDLPWAEVPYRKQVAFSGGRYNDGPQADTDRLATIRASFEHTTHPAWRDTTDVGWLLGRVDQLAADLAQAHADVNDNARLAFQARDRADRLRKRLLHMATAWEQLPDTIRTATAVEAIRNLLEHDHA